MSPSAAIGAGYVDLSRTVADRVADPRQDLVARRHRVPLVLAHQSRNDSAAGSGKSRAAVHAESGGGSERIRDSRRPLRAAPSPRTNRFGEAMTHEVAAIAARSGVGIRRRSASTARVRRCTSIVGMSIFTGQAS